MKKSTQECFVDFRDDILYACVLCCAFVCLVFSVSLSVLVYDCTYLMSMQRPEEDILCSAMSFWVASLGYCLSLNLELGYQATRVSDPYVFVFIALRLQGHSLMARDLNGYQRCAFNFSCLQSKPSYFTEPSSQAQDDSFDIIFFSVFAL